MKEIEKFEGFIFFNLSGDSFDARFLRNLAMNDGMRRDAWRTAFEWVLKNRPYSAQEWEDQHNSSFDTDDELYAHLGAVFEYVFNRGPKDFKF